MIASGDMVARLEDCGKRFRGGWSLARGIDMVGQELETEWQEFAGNSRFAERCPSAKAIRR
jgi:hypothetical protein